MKRLVCKLFGHRFHAQGKPVLWFTCDCGAQWAGQTALSMRDTFVPYRGS